MFSLHECGGKYLSVSVVVMLTARYFSCVTFMYVETCVSELKFFPCWNMPTVVAIFPIIKLSNFKLLSENVNVML